MVANDGEPCSAVQFFRVSLSGGPGTGTCMYIFDITWPGTHKLHLKMKKNEKKGVQTNQR